MREKVRRFKGMSIAIKELEPFIKSGHHLRTGRPLKAMGGLLSRELLGNWLLCAILNYKAASDRFVPASDLSGSDGNLMDCFTATGYQTEHVSIFGSPGLDAASAILGAIADKQGKGGKSYASGKYLVIFVEGFEQPWFPDAVVGLLRQPVDFEGIWVFSLRAGSDDGYIYAVTRLDSRGCPVWLVNLAPTFDNWQVCEVRPDPAAHI